jgi:membrane complex biogenesis BtpA family protein
VAHRTGDVTSLLGDLFRSAKTLIGMVHLLPLPGSPGYEGDLERVFEQALADARTLAAGGADAVLVENFGDAPFHKYVEPVTISAMAIAVRDIARAVEIPVGVNVLRNDARAALSIAATAGARFIRVNVHAGAMVTDQGIIEGRADDTLRLRRELAADVAICADVFVKHAFPIGAQSLEQSAKDTAFRGFADALVISGAATGEAADMDEVRRVRTAVGEFPILVGSGTTLDNVSQILRLASGVIVGTALKVDGKVSNPVDPARVRAFRAQIPR